MPAVRPRLLLYLTTMFAVWMVTAQLSERILAIAQERGRIINKFADLLEEHTDELAALDSCAAVPPLYPGHLCMPAFTLRGCCPGL